MSHSSVLPTPCPLPPDLLAWRRTLGEDTVHDDAWVAQQAQAWLERNRWVPIGETWPSPGQAVEVIVMTQGTGQPFVADACFKDRDPSPRLLWPWDTDEQGHAIPNASLASMNRDDLRDRTHGPCFTMAGGDWSATFKGPLFSRRGMDYVAKAKDPLLLITHWRAASQVPENLAVPPHLRELLEPKAAAPV